MLKHLLRMVLTFVIGTSTVALSQTYYCYRESGSSVNLTVQDSIVSVKLDESKLSWQGLFLSEEGLDSTVAPEAICEGFSLLRVTPGHDPVALVDRLRSLVGVLFANLSFLDAYANPIYLTETFVANFYANATQAEIDSMNNAHGVVIIDSLFDDPTWLLLKVTATSDLDVLAMGNHYQESALVRYAKAGMVLNLQLDSQPNDDYWWYQWHFYNDTQLGGKNDADIDLEQAFDYYRSPSTFITVAILDDGFAPHEDFPASRIIGGWDYFNDRADYSPGPEQFHGMAVMGIIGATTAYNWNDPSVGVAGISDHVKIWGQKITDNEGNYITSDPLLAKAFSDAVLAGARIISCSWGCRFCGAGAGYDTTAWWIRKADSAGLSLVFSAGNSGQAVGWPAMIPEVLAVGATDSLDQRWLYSANGPELDVVAPSSRIPAGEFAGSFTRGLFWTLDQMGGLGMNDGWLPCGSPSDTTQYANYNCAFGGTSAAAPQVAGVIALILLRRPDLIGTPGMTEQIREIIRHSSQDGVGDWQDTPGWDQYYGWGRLNADRAIMAVVRGDANNDGAVDVGDAAYVLAYAFGGPPPQPKLGTGDANCDGGVDISDAVYLIAYIFGGGPPPPICSQLSDSCEMSAACTTLRRLQFFNQRAKLINISY